jgi:hypothetical protein
VIPKIKRLVAPNSTGEGEGEGDGKGVGVGEGDGKGVGVGVGLGNGVGVGETVGEGLGVGWIVAPVILPLAHPVRQIKTTQLKIEQETRNNHLLLMSPIPYRGLQSPAFTATCAQMPRTAAGSYAKPAPRPLIFGFSFLAISPDDWHIFFIVAGRFYAANESARILI